MLFKKESDELKRLSEENKSLKREIKSREDHIDGLISDLCRKDDKCRELEDKLSQIQVKFNSTGNDALIQKLDELLQRLKQQRPEHQ